MKQKTVLEWYHVLIYGSLILMVLCIIINMMPWMYVDYARAYQILKLDGETDIRLLGYTPFGCPKNTPYHTKFSARDPYDMQITGVVCSTSHDGSTIVYDQY
jgi:hypothetical protein